MQTTLNRKSWIRRKGTDASIVFGLWLLKRFAPRFLKRLPILGGGWAAVLIMAINAIRKRNAARLKE